VLEACIAPVASAQGEPPLSSVLLRVLLWSGRGGLWFAAGCTDSPETHQLKAAGCWARIVWWARARLTAIHGRWRTIEEGLLKC
jgi:hypothetical protein